MINYILPAIKLSTDYQVIKLSSYQQTIRQSLRTHFLFKLENLDLIYLFIDMLFEGVTTSLGRWCSLCFEKTFLSIYWILSLADDEALVSTSYRQCPVIC